VNYVGRYFASTDHHHSSVDDAAAADDDGDGERTFVALILDSLLHHDCESRVAVSTDL